MLGPKTKLRVFHYTDHRSDIQRLTYEAALSQAATADFQPPPIEGKHRQRIKLAAKHIPDFLKERQ